MSTEEDDFYTDEDAENSLGDIEFELLNSSDDEKIICLTLYCYSKTELSPSEYAQALIEYAKRIECISMMSDIPVNSKN